MQEKTTSGQPRSTVKMAPFKNEFFLTQLDYHDNLLLLWNKFWGKDKQLQQEPTMSNPTWHHQGRSNKTSSIPNMNKEM
jgi:hypothetical protein